MAISRKRIQELFLKDAERARLRKEQAFQERLTAEDTGKGRLLEIGAGAAGGFLTGGPAGAVLGGVSAATGKGDALESGIGGAVGGITSKGLEPTGDIAKTVGKMTNLENIAKTLPVLKAAGAPKKLTQGLEVYSKAQSLKEATKQKVITGRESEKLKEEERRKTLLAVEKAKSRTASLKESRKGRATPGDTQKQIRQARKEAVNRYDKFEEKVKEEGVKKADFIEDYIKFKIEGKVPEYKEELKQRLFGLRKPEVVKTRTGRFVEPPAAKAEPKEEFVTGKIYKDAQGNRAKYKGNGDWEIL